MYNFFCFNEKRKGCKLCNAAGRCQSDKKTAICPKTQKALKLMGETIAGLIGPKMSKAAIKIDRRSRSRKHFRQKIYPSLSKNDRLTFDMNQKRKKLLKQPPLK